MPKLLKGKPVANKILKEIKQTIIEKNINPKLVVIIIGNEPASEYYVQSIIKRGHKVGIQVEKISFEETISNSVFLKKIAMLNDDLSVSGIMIQKPLPLQINIDELTTLINPLKDVDAFNPINVGKMVLGKDGFIPCTAQAVLELLKFYEINTNGKHVVILGRSDVIGKPLANLLLRKDETGNATITICHSRTNNLPLFTKQADILVAAIGIPKFVKKSHIKDDCILVDVGVNQVLDENGKAKYVGDIDFEDCFEVASRITPVPGGIGTITTAVLLKNVIKKLL